MADLKKADPRVQRKISEISKRWSVNATADAVYKAFAKDKYSLEKQLQFLRQYFKSHVSDFDIHYKQFEENVRKNNKSSEEAFILFLTNAPIATTSAKSLIAKKPTLSGDSKLSGDFPSPNLCSTRVDGNYKQDVVVSEVRSSLL